MIIIDTTCKTEPEKIIKEIIGIYINSELASYALAKEIVDALKRAGYEITNVKADLAGKFCPSDSVRN